MSEITFLPFSNDHRPEAHRGKPAAWRSIEILIYSGPCTVQVGVAMHDELGFCAKDSCVSKPACIMAVLLILL